MVKKVKVSQQQSDRAASRALAARGGSAFRITSGQRKAIVNGVKRSSSTGRFTNGTGSSKRSGTGSS